MLGAFAVFFSASSSSVRLLIAAIASGSVDSIVTTTALPFTASFVVAPSTVLGHMPALWAIASAAPGAVDPAAAEPGAAEPVMDDPAADPAAGSELCFLQPAASVSSAADT